MDYKRKGRSVKKITATQSGLIYSPGWNQPKNITGHKHNNLSHIFACKILALKNQFFLLWTNFRPSLFSSHLKGRGYKNSLNNQDGSADVLSKIGFTTSIVSFSQEVNNRSTAINDMTAPVTLMNLINVSLSMQFPWNRSFPHKHTQMVNAEVTLVMTVHVCKWFFCRFIVLMSCCYLQCSVTCGRGVRTREVTCQKGRRTHLPDMECAKLPKPLENSICMTMSCPAYHWAATPWSKVGNTYPYSPVNRLSWKFFCLR